MKESERVFEDVKVLCISKLERTHQAYNVAQNADHMDDKEGEESIMESANNRRYTRKIGGSKCPMNIKEQPTNKPVRRHSAVVNRSLLPIVTAT